MSPFLRVAASSLACCVAAGGALAACGGDTFTASASNDAAADAPLGDGAASDGAIDDGSIADASGNDACASVSTTVMNAALAKVRSAILPATDASNVSALWLAPEGIASIKPGTGVDTWPDASGLANNDATSGSCQAPIVKDSGPCGNRYVAFNAAGDPNAGRECLTLASGRWSDFQGGMTFFGVVRFHPQAGTARIFELGTTNNSQTSNFMIARSDTVAAMFRVVAFSSTAALGPNELRGNVIQDDRWRLYEAFLPPGTSANDVANGEVWVDGVVSTTPPGTMTSPTNPGPRNYGMLGAPTNTNAQAPRTFMDLGEMILVARAMSNVQRVEVRTFLKQRWGIP